MKNGVSPASISIRVSQSATGYQFTRTQHGPGARERNGERKQRLGRPGQVAPGADVASFCSVPSARERALIALVLALLLGYVVFYRRPVDTVRTPTYQRSQKERKSLVRKQRGR